MATQTDIKVQFKDNPVATDRPDHYMEINDDTAKIMKSWRASLFSFEWLLPDGRIKTAGELSETERPRREAVEDALKQNQSLDKPVLPE